MHKKKGRCCRMENKLTEKQEQFCNEYLIDLNATQAAIRAGYKEKTAYSAGQRLLKHVEIQKRIQQLKNERSERTEISQDMVLKELAAIGFADATDFVKVVIKPLYNSDGEPILDSSGKQVTIPCVEITETANLKDEQKKAIAGIKEGRNGIEVKLNDKTKALELLGRHLGMWNDKQDINLTAVNIEDFIK